MGKLTIDDFIHLLFNHRVELSEKSGLKPNQFFNGVSKNKCNYRIGKRVPVLDHGYEFAIVKKEFFPSEENIKKAIDEYDNSHTYQIFVDIPPMKSCIKYFFGDKVEYDSGYSSEGNILGHDHQFMLTMPVNLSEVPNAIRNRFNVIRSYSDKIDYDGTQFYYYHPFSAKKNKMKFTEFKQLIQLSHGAQYLDDDGYDQLIKDIRLCKIVCKDHSSKLLISRARGYTINNIKVYAGAVFKTLSKIN